MTQPTVDPLNGHRFILANIVPPNRQEGVVRRIIVCTVQRDAPGFQPLQQPVQRGGITTATFPIDEALARAIKSQPDPQLVLFFEGNARVRPVPSQPRSRPDPVEGAARALRHELGSNSELRGVETPSCLAMAFIDKVYNNTAVSFFHSGSPRGGLKLVCRRQSLHFHFAGAALRVGTP